MAFQGLPREFLAKDDTYGETGMFLVAVPDEDGMCTVYGVDYGTQDWGDGRAVVSVENLDDAIAYIDDSDNPIKIGEVYEDFLVDDGYEWQEI